MSYQPTPDDVRCANCKEWFHKALKSCPMCDAPNNPRVAPQKPATPSAPVYQQLAAPSADTIVIPVGKLKKVLPWLAPILLLSVALAFPVVKAIQKAQVERSAGGSALITREQYEDIQDGMSYRQVVEIVGSRGKLDWDDDGLRERYEREVVYETGTRTKVLIVLRRDKVVDKVWTE